MVFGPELIIDSSLLLIPTLAMIVNV